MTQKNVETVKYLSNAIVISKPAKPLLFLRHFYSNSINRYSEYLFEKSQKATTRTLCYFDSFVFDKECVASYLYVFHYIQS